MAKKKEKKKEMKRRPLVLVVLGLKKTFVECSFENVNLEFRKQSFRNGIRWEVFGFWLLWFVQFATVTCCQAMHGGMSLLLNLVNMFAVST